MEQSLGNVHYQQHQQTMVNSASNAAAAAPMAAPNKKVSEMLDDYCRVQNFGSPQYERSMVTFKDGLGRDTPFFNYKITIPALTNTYGSFQWTKLWPTDSDAREAAAQFVFLQLGVFVQVSASIAANGNGNNFLF